MEVIKQICIKSYEVTDQNGNYWEAEKGKEYTTTIPSEDDDTIVVFSSFWVPVPKEYFIPVGDGVN